MKMEGSPNRQEAMPQNYLDQFIDYATQILKRAKTPLMIGAVSGFAAINAGCQAEMNGHVYEPRPGEPNIQTRLFNGMMERTHEVQAIRQEQTHISGRFVDQSSGRITIDIDSSGQRHLSGNFNENRHLYTEPGSMAAKQEQNRQEALRKEREDKHKK